MSRNSMQLNLPPALVKRVANAPSADVNDVDTEADMPLADAQRVLGMAISQAITRSGFPLKSFGDKGQVSRWCQGENPNLARLWQRRKVRLALVIALAEASGAAEVTVTIRLRESA